MFEAPPPPPPALTAQQTADVQCVRMGRTYITLSLDYRLGAEMIRVYLGRLISSDAQRDWMSMTEAFPDDLPYRDFLRIRSRCLADLAERSAKP